MRWSFRKTRLKSNMRWVCWDSSLRTQTLSEDDQGKDRDEGISNKTCIVDLSKETPFFFFTLMQKRGEYL